MNIAIKVGNRVGYLRSDSKNYMFGYERPSVSTRTGDTTMTYNPEIFHSTLPAMMESLLNLKVKASTATTLVELQEDIAQARREIADVWGKSIDLEGE